MHPRYAVVWVDHQEARVLVLHREDSSFDERLIHARHTKDDARHSSGRRHPVTAEAHFFGDVAEAMSGVTDAWVVGPANAKLELVAHLDKHNHDLMKAVKGTETVDHPTNGELAEAGRRFFEKLVAPRQIFVRA